jgi:hypothetical protein
MPNLLNIAGHQTDRQYAYGKQLELSSHTRDASFSPTNLKHCGTKLTSTVYQVRNPLMNTCPPVPGDGRQACKPAKGPILLNYWNNEMVASVRLRGTMPRRE